MHHSSPYMAQVCTSCEKEEVADALGYRVMPGTVFLYTCHSLSSFKQCASGRGLHSDLPPNDWWLWSVCGEKNQWICWMRLNVYTGARLSKFCPEFLMQAALAVHMCWRTISVLNVQQIECSKLYYEPGDSEDWPEHALVCMPKKMFNLFNCAVLKWSGAIITDHLKRSVS